MPLSDHDHVSVPKIREAVMGCEDIDLEQKVSILASLDIQLQAERSFTITVEITVSAYNSDGTPIDEDEVWSAFDSAVQSVSASDLYADELNIEGFTVRED